MKRILLILILIAFPFMLDAQRSVIRAPYAEAGMIIRSTGGGGGTVAYISNEQVDNSAAQSGSTLLNIPTDCTAILVVNTGSYNGSGDSAFTKLNWDDLTGIEFTLIGQQQDGGDSYDIAAYIMSADDTDWPGTGNHTIYYGLNYGNSEGGNIFAIYLKVVDQSTPNGDSDGDFDKATFTASLTGVGSGDMGFICTSGWGSPTLDVTSNGQSALLSGSGNSATYACGYETGESAMYGENSDTSYGGYLAFSVNAN